MATGLLAKEKAEDNETDAIPSRRPGDSLSRPASSFTAPWPPTSSVRPAGPSSPLVTTAPRLRPRLLGSRRWRGQPRRCRHLPFTFLTKAKHSVAW